MRKKLLRGFHLGDYFVEPLAGKVTGRGSRGHLPSKAVEILLCLAGEPRTVVSRDELLRAVWGEGGGTQEGLNRAVSELRHAFDDHALDPHYIQTLPKRGYRLLVDPEFPTAGAVEAGRAPSDQNATSVYGELTRRGVIETGIAYLLVGWLLVQIADVTFDDIGLPQWATSFVTFLVIAGFPISLLLSWFIEITRRGAILDDGQGARFSRKRFSGTYLAIVGALALASVGVFAYHRTVGLPVDTGGRLITTDRVAEEVIVDANTIAVLPLLNIDGSEETEIFSNGLVEDVIDRLSRIPGLRVSSRGDSFSLPPNTTSSEVRRRLRVHYYIGGSVRAVAENIRVVFQLIESESGKHLLSRSFDQKKKDFFEIQDQITSLAIANLRVALPEDSQAVFDPVVGVASIDAYVLYRRGIEELHKPRTEATNERALSWFGKALAIDPDYAAAHAGICLTYSSGFNLVDNSISVAEAENACARALTLNPNLNVVHNALGDLYEKTGKPAAAEASYRRALAINPNDAQALIGLAIVYSGQQNLPEAEQKFDEAIALQPGNWRSYNALGGFLYRYGRYVEAADVYTEVVSLDPENMQGWANLGTSLMLSGNFQDAAPAFERSIKIEPQNDAYGNLGLMYYYLGETEAAIAALEAATQLSPRDHLAWSNLGDALSFSNQSAEAARAYERAEDLAEQLLAVNRRDANTTIDLAWIKAVLGKTADAEQLIARGQRIAYQDPYVHYINGLILTRLGDHEAAMAALETAVQMGYPLVMLAAEPQLESLQDQPRFLALTAGKSLD